MKIYSIQNFYSNQHTRKIQHKKNAVTFGSLKLRNDENNFSDTCFYRDIPTLISATKILKEEFPRGTIIMDFAGSNGEEAISLYSLLNDTPGNNYKIYSYDKSETAVKLGQKGIYTIFSTNAGDNFLLTDTKYAKRLNDNKGFIKKLRNCFYEIMEPAKRPDYTINDPVYLYRLMAVPDFEVKYFKLKNRYKNKIKIEEGDINNIENLLPQKKAGAILFRNAFYIETGNYGVNEFNLFEDLSINKKEIIEKIVDKVYDKLLPGGLFILGDIEKDHIYIADNNVKDEDKYFIANYGVEIYKEPILWKALQKDNRFEPVFYKKISAPCAFNEEMKIPTIWRKK